MTVPAFPAYPTVPHGGNLAQAITQYGLPRAQWLDLSTGINPNGYAVPAISAETWLRLPDDHDGLDEIAAAYYAAPAALAVAGTQAAIQALPRLLTPGVIGINLLTYGEYAPAFAAAGFSVARYCTEATAEFTAGFVLTPGMTLPAHIRHLVVVNPNNPGTELFSAADLLAWHAQLQARGGYLIVDEAFLDAQPAQSIAAHSALPGLIVLRSIGKFFGLAGARVGFVLAQTPLLQALRSVLGPWSVAGPARAVVRAALLDTAWQNATRPRLLADSQRLAQLLAAHGLPARHTALFAWVRSARAAWWQDQLAQRGIWVRRFDHVPGLRFGLPADDAAWARLHDAMQTIPATPH